MTENETMVDYLLCADWSKEQKGRALYMANVLKREVRRVRKFPLTLDSALAQAGELAKDGTVLLSFDLPLGLPNSFLSALRKLPGWEAASSFPCFLPIAAQAPAFFVSRTQASRWSLRQPFFKVPPGAGARAAFEEAAAHAGVQLRRRIDVRTGGNPMFITGGIPGSVGSAAIDVWLGLAHLLPLSREFKIWPFEGTFPELFASAPIIIAENYPRAAYAAAFCDISRTNRPRMGLSKTRAETRHEAIKFLLSRPWVHDSGVTLHDTDAALADENQFDALVTAAGLLRLVIEEEPLSSGTLEDPVAEDGILGTGTMNFDLPEVDFVPNGGTRQGGPFNRGVYCADKPSGHAGSGSEFRCPIPQCAKVFIGSRGGWDGHVGASRMHPNWQPHVKDHRERLKVFRAEYPEFFD
jgi:hypothetical protein